MHLFSITLLAITVSFDSLAIGMAYGISQITIPNLSKILLSIVSGMLFLLAMLISKISLAWVSLSHSQTIGGIVLIGIGVYNIWRVGQPQHKDNTMPVQNQFEHQMLYRFRMILKEPLVADYDHSKTLSIQEGFLLGIALSLDALVCGVAAAVMGFSPVSTAISVMMANYIFISLGLRYGKKWQGSFLISSIKFFPGLIIIIIGVIKIFL